MRRWRLPIGANGLVAAVWLAGCGNEGENLPLVPHDGEQPAPVTDLTALTGDPSSITLTFTATGDDGQQGRAAAYDLRHAPFPADPEAWPSWAQMASLAPPRSVGEAETLRVTGLETNRAFAFLIRVADETGNWSPASNVAVASTGDRLDTTPPGAVQNLCVWASTPSSVTLAWEAPGDDGAFGTAAAYDVRHADLPITPANWESATPLPIGAMPAPQPAGARQFASVAGLAPATTHHFALVADDEAGNQSPLSNDLAAFTERFRTWYLRSDGSGDVSTLRSACVDSARPGDLILLAPGRYTWSNQGDGDPFYGMIFLPRDVTGFTIRGEAGVASTIIDAEGRGRVFFLMGISPGSTSNVTFEGLTLTGGNALASAGDESPGGGVVFHLCSPVFRNCVFRGNRAVYGGGLAQAGVGSVRLEDCLFDENVADYGAGLALATQQSYPEVIRCVFRRNHATVSGGGVYAGRVQLVMENCTLLGNLSDDKGGGLYAAELENSRLVGCTFAENAALVGGAIRLAVDCHVALQRSLFVFSANGGGLRFYGDNQVTIECCDIFGNDDGDQLPPGTVDQGGNFSLDPLFCGAQGSGRLTLQPASPCAPGQHPTGAACGLIGAEGVDCARR